MRSYSELRARLKRGPTDLVGIEIDSRGVYAVRMRKTAGAVSVVAADILPPLPRRDDPDASPVALSLPPKLKAPYACVTLSGEGSVVKLLSFPGRFDAEAEEKVLPGMGLSDPEKYRIAYKLVSEGHGRAESRLLAVAMPGEHVGAATALLPTGRPAVYSLEISGLAAMAAFLHAKGNQHAEETIGALEFGEQTSTFMLVHDGTVALVRLFDFGTQAVVDKIRQSLGLDADTARSAMAESSFDLSHPVGEVMEPFLKQIIASRDFVERRENCHLSRVYVSGPLRLSRDCLDVCRSAMDVDTWDPFESLSVGRDAIPPHAAGQHWRFAAAIGSCLATFEET